MSVGGRVVGSSVLDDDFVAASARATISEDAQARRAQARRLSLYSTIQRRIEVLRTQVSYSQDCAMPLRVLHVFLPVIG